LEVSIRAVKRGMFPTLPAAAPPGASAVPVAWMVPGFDCVTRYWFGQDRGGLLVVSQVELK
ncbi:hypothetical protein LCGC14_2434290, partial [marine sediment metagenome]